MNTLKAIFHSSLLLLAFMDFSVAHHSFAFEFDRNQNATLEGEVTWVRFSNPHVTYRVRTQLENGAMEEWQVQTHNVGMLLGINWDQDTIKVGDKIKLSGALGRNSSKKIFMEWVTLANGEVRNILDGASSSAYDIVDINADPDKSYGVAPTAHPYDITGAWNNRYKFQITAGDLEPKPTPFTEEGRRIHEATKEWEDPAKTCSPMGLPRAFGAPFNLEIVDAGGYYLMVAYGGVRRIWLDEREAPEGLLASPMGFSTGKWDNNVFIIETSHLSQSWLDGLGLPMSGEGTRIIETYTLSEDQLTMDRKMIIHDPYYTEPLIRERGSARDDDIQFQLVAGTTPCDPTAHYRDMWEQDLLESLWGFN
ncbi:MAG: DUF6152 family protein [Gammaproteobacteria bacterium]|nr:DUF6152 family protein [Gammaproteobacteria bacterium]|tara:strand:- start:186 stop:1280 length:1095 start_codon:yes stop_codon:yes gene_type:complete